MDRFLSNRVSPMQNYKVELGVISCYVSDVVVFAKKITTTIGEEFLSGKIPELSKICSWNW